MHRFENRPPKPDDFDSDSKVSTARTAVQKAIRKNKKPKFPEVWKKWKPALSKAQHRKCGFCESVTVVTTYGDVEHFCPKGEVWELKDDPSTWGVEVEDAANVKGREHVSVADRGYYWLAYAWDNYLLSCTICNRGWKQAFFPVHARPDGPPEEAVAEQQLLLHPFRGRRPSKHLLFGRLGEVKPRNNSKYGRETIKTCGLNRPSLRDARQGIAGRTHRRIDKLDTVSEPAAIDEILDALLEDGKETEAYCGMVRAIFEERTDSTWKDLEEMFEE